MSDNKGKISGGSDTSGLQHGGIVPAPVGQSFCYGQTRPDVGIVPAASASLNTGYGPEERMVKVLTKPWARTLPEKTLRSIARNEPSNREVALAELSRRGVGPEQKAKSTLAASKKDAGGVFKAPQPSTSSARTGRRAVVDPVDDYVTNPNVGSTFSSLMWERKRRRTMSKEDIRSAYATAAEMADAAAAKRKSSDDRSRKSSDDRDRDSSDDRSRKSKDEDRRLPEIGRDLAKKRLDFVDPDEGDTVEEKVRAVGDLLEAMGALEVMPVVKPGKGVPFSRLYNVGPTLSRVQMVLGDIRDLSEEGSTVGSASKTVPKEGQDLPEKRVTELAKRVRELEAQQKLTKTERDLVLKENATLRGDCSRLRRLFKLKQGGEVITAKAIHRAAPLLPPRGREGDRGAGPLGGGQGLVPAAASTSVARPLGDGRGLAPGAVPPALPPPSRTKGMRGAAAAPGAAGVRGAPARPAWGGEEFPPLPPPAEGEAWAEVRSKKGLRKERQQRARERGDTIPAGAAAPPRKVPPPPPKKRKVPQTAAVTITALPGQVYADVLKTARLGVDLKEIGVETVSLKRAINGGYIFEIAGPERATKAERLARDLEAVLSGAAKIARPVKFAELRVSGLDDTADLEEVERVIRANGEIARQDLRIGKIQKGPDGLGSVWVRCPLAAALRMEEQKFLPIGWLRARVRLLEERPLQCFRCLGFGHTVAACVGQIDRQGKCFRCGVAGHVAQSCENNPHCALCDGAGRNAGHRMGGKACQAVPTSGARNSPRARARTRKRGGRKRRKKRQEPGAPIGVARPAAQLVQPAAQMVDGGVGGAEKRAPSTTREPTGVPVGGAPGRQDEGSGATEAAPTVRCGDAERLSPETFMEVQSLRDLQEGFDDEWDSGPLT